MQTEIFAQKPVGYLGPQGTFTQCAAETLCPGAVFVPTGDIGGVLAGVTSGVFAAGVVPLENSTEGAVNETLDLLLAESGHITAVLQLPIRHCLLVAPQSNGHFTRILAHGQALSQCREFLRRTFPGIALQTCTSNGEAAALVAAQARKGHASLAAIGPCTAAPIYNLCIFQENIQDQHDNRTAFIRYQAAPCEAPHEGPQRTSVVFATQNQPGALYHMLGIFQHHNVNMTKILSRPMPEQPGAYRFFVDVEATDPTRVHAALAAVEATAQWYKFLGTYPILAQ